MSTQPNIESMNQDADPIKQGSDDEQVESLQAVDEEELNRLFELYLPKLIQVADKNIANQLKHKFDADDIAISVIGTIFRRIQNGTFHFEDDAEFWRLLVTIACLILRE